MNSSARRRYCLQVEVAQLRTPFAGRRRAGRSTRDSTSGRGADTPCGRPRGGRSRTGGRPRRRAATSQPAAARDARGRGTLAAHATTPRRHRRARRHHASPTAGRASRALDDFVVFVRGAVPGDRVRARVTQAQAVARARRGRWRSSPPPRAASPPAARHSHDCGGCEWQTLAYDAQLEFKQQQVVDSLQRLGAPRRLRARAHPRHGRPVALPQQDGVLVRRGRGRRARARACTSAARGGRSSRPRLPAWPRSA